MTFLRFLWNPEVKEKSTNDISACFFTLFFPQLFSKQLYIKYLLYKLRCSTRISSPEKSCKNTYGKNTIFFHACLISPIGRWHVTRLLRNSARLMSERQSLRHSQSMVVCRNFVGIWLLKHCKITIAWRKWRQNFRKTGRKPKYQKKPRVTYSAALVMEILAAENKNRQLQDLPEADFGCLPGRFLLSVKSIPDNFCILKITPTVVFVMIQRVFFLS